MNYVFAVAYYNKFPGFVKEATQIVKRGIYTKGELDRFENVELLSQVVYLELVTVWVLRRVLWRLWNLPPNYAAISAKRQRQPYKPRLGDVAPNF